MHIDRLVLTDFRNYERLIWRPERKISVFTGENGSGKTNLLEAVSLLAPGRGLRGAAISQLTRHHAQAWGIAAALRLSGETVDVSTGTDPKGGARRIFRLNDAPVRTSGDIARYCACVWVTPQMDRLFSEAGSGRRRFLDRLVVALDPYHARETASHDRAVAQRNRLLAERPSETAWLSAVEDSIARHAVAATASRMALIDGMNGLAFDFVEFPRCELGLECLIGAELEKKSALLVEDHLRERLVASRVSDRARGSCGVGAHRADLVIRDRASGRSDTYSSSGQQKAMLLGVILAHATLIAERRGAAPALLLDEPLVHLDMKRREALLASIDAIDAPVLITGTEREPFSSLRARASFLKVVEGRLIDNSF